MSDAFIGEIRNFTFNFAPRGWLPCNGDLLQITQNQALYSLLFNQFGGDGTKTFALPDLRGRVPVGSIIPAYSAPPPAPRTTYTTGRAGGAETVALGATNVPSHAHDLVVATDKGGAAAPAGDFIATAVPTTTSTQNINCYLDTGWTADVGLNAGSVTVTGASTGHNNMQPYLVTNYCICVSGIYPSRP